LGKALAVEPPPEITTTPWKKTLVPAIAPEVVQELLHVEGFADIRM
jgi:hypothetical protein